jgi:hypothetical protein
MCPSSRLNPDPRKNIFSFWQLGGGHGSWYPHKECVTTHRPNEKVSKMDGAKDEHLYRIKRKKNLKKGKYIFSFVGGRGDSQKKT